MYPCGVLQHHEMESCKYSISAVVYMTKVVCKQQREMILITNITVRSCF